MLISPAICCLLLDWDARDASSVHLLWVSVLIGSCLEPLFTSVCLVDSPSFFQPLLDGIVDG